MVMLPNRFRLVWILLVNCGVIWISLGDLFFISSKLLAPPSLEIPFRAAIDAVLVLLALAATVAELTKQPLSKLLNLTVPATLFALSILIIRNTGFGGLVEMEAGILLLVPIAIPLIIFAITWRVFRNAGTQVTPTAFEPHH